MTQMSAYAGKKGVAFLSALTEAPEMMVSREETSLMDPWMAASNLLPRSLVILAIDEAALRGQNSCLLSLDSGGT